MFTLSSYNSSYFSTVLTEYGKPDLPAIRRKTFRRLNTHILPKNLLGKVMSPARLTRNTR
jgi:hypothetical protein